MKNPLRTLIDYIRSKYPIQPGDIIEYDGATLEVQAIFYRNYIVQDYLLIKKLHGSFYKGLLPFNIIVRSSFPKIQRLTKTQQEMMRLLHL